MIITHNFHLILSIISANRVQHICIKISNENNVFNVRFKYKKRLYSRFRDFLILKLKFADFKSKFGPNHSNTMLRQAFDLYQLMRICEFKN